MEPGNGPSSLRAGSPALPPARRHGAACGAERGRIAVQCETALAAVARDFQRQICALEEPREIVAAAELLADIAGAIDRVRRSGRSQLRLIPRES